MMVGQRMAIDLAVAHLYNAKVGQDDCRDEVERIFGPGVLGEHVSYGGMCWGPEFTVVRVILETKKWFPKTETIISAMTKAFNEARPKGHKATWRFLGNECWVHRTIRTEGELAGRSIEPFGGDK